MKTPFKSTVVLTSAVMILSLAACTPSELTEGSQPSAGGTTKLLPRHLRVGFVDRVSLLPFGLCDGNGLYGGYAFRTRP